MSIADSAINGLMAGLTAAALLQWGRQLPGLEKLTIMESMKPQMSQAAAFVALSAVAGQLIGKPVSKVVMGLVGVKVQTSGVAAA